MDFWTFLIYYYILYVFAQPSKEEKNRHAVRHGGRDGKPIPDN
jgi:hypothetical protein